MCRKLLKKFAENIKWELIGEAIEVKHSPSDKDIVSLIELGKQMARRLKENDSSFSENNKPEMI